MLIANPYFTLYPRISQWLCCRSTECLLCSQAMDDYNGTALSSPCVPVSCKVFWSASLLVVRMSEKVIILIVLVSTINCILCGKPLMLAETLQLIHKAHVNR